VTCERLSPPSSSGHGPRERSGPSRPAARPATRPTPLRLRIRERELLRLLASVVTDGEDDARDRRRGAHACLDGHGSASITAPSLGERISTLAASGRAPARRGSGGEGASFSSRRWRSPRGGGGARRDRRRGRRARATSAPAPAPSRALPGGRARSEALPGIARERPLDDPDEPPGRLRRRADERLAPPVPHLTRSSTTVSPMNAGCPRGTRRGSRRARRRRPPARPTASRRSARAPCSPPSRGARRRSRPRRTGSPRESVSVPTSRRGRPPP